MEVIPLLIILTMFCQNATAVEQDLQLSRVMFDLTRPVNELIAEEISQQDFSSDVNAALNPISGNITTFTIFYTTAASTIEQLASRTQDVCNILHETLNINSNTQLLVSWKLNGTTIGLLNISLLYNQTFDNCSPNFVLHFNKDTGCAGVPDIFDELLVSNKRTFVGVSYDESLHKCESLSLWKVYAQILIVNLKFGKTRGVTESFGLFQLRMKFLSETVEFDDHGKPIIYYPNPYSVGKDEHQKLLIRYASIWTTSNQTRGSILFQMPNSRNKASEMAQFSIIPELRYYIPDEGESTSSPQEDILSSLLLFTASFQRQQLVAVDNGILKLWNSLPERNIQPPQLRDMVSTIDIVLRCSYSGCGKLPSRINAGNKATTVSGGILPETAEQITPELTIACTYQGAERFSVSNVELAVKICQRINASVYILVLEIELKMYSELGKYSFFFENTIRKKLHAVNRLRNGIMEKDPSGKVYFQLFIDDQRGVDVHESEASSSLFCDELGHAVNLYVEGIFNWAKLENFPVIRGLPYSQNTSFFINWSPLLRRLNYPYPEWTVKGRNPAFLMQEHLKSVHKWEPDACIDWTERRWEITEDFFHNSKIGTVFYPSNILNKRSLTEEECITMLHFIFYRFRLVEISVSSDFRNLLAAIEYKKASQDFNGQIFVKYTMTEHQTHLSKFKSFIDQLIKMFEKGLLNGVHAGLVLEPGMNNWENISNSDSFESILNMMKYAKLSNVTCGIELPSVQVCYQILQKFIFSDVYVELFGTVNYLVIKETLKPLAWSYNKLELQILLDSHLTVKRTLDLMIPNFRLYFRVEFDFKIDFENNAELDRYTNFLALFKTFGTQYDISYFVGVSFDGQSLPNQNGWWGIKNYSDLTNPQLYLEKVMVSRGYPMWYPANLPASPSITVPNSIDSPLVTIVSSVGSAVLFLLVVLVICGGLRYRKLQHLSRFLSDSEVQEFLNGRGSTNTEPANTEMELMGSVEHMKFNEEYKLDLPDLIIDFNKILGSGAFGTVYHGFTKGVPAAIKRPIGDCSKSTFKSVLSEVKVLSYVGNHPNVVGFLGAYVEEIYKGVLYISTELCALGSLESFLRNKNTVTSQTVSNQGQSTELDGSVINLRDLNIFALEIAKGMEYIESRRVIHGDLSTRNVLLDENLVCKIGDFGLSRKLYEYQKYVKSSQEPLPWKWMAPESLTKMEFTSKTDVWSYGVAAWEIYSLGNIPYSGLNWSVDFSNELENGLRLPSPDFASPEIYAKLLECWNFDPDERPTFADMINFFNGLTEVAYMILNSIEEQPESTIE